VGSFLGNDGSLARGSLDNDDAAGTVNASSSILRFFCRLALRTASSSGSGSSRTGFFRFTLVVAVRVCFSTAFSLSLSFSLSAGIVFLDIRIVEVALGFLSWVCWVDAVEGGLDCEEVDSFGVGWASAGVAGLDGVSTPSCADALRVFDAADPESLFAGPCERDIDLDAGEFVGSFAFALAALKDAFALSSFICTSVLGFCPSAFTLAFFSLTSFDITPRFASGFDELEDEPPVVAFGEVPWDEPAPAAEPNAGVDVVVLLYLTLSQAGSVTGIFRLLNAILAFRAMVIRSSSVSFHWKGRTSSHAVVLRTHGRGDLSPFF